ncbi:MAG: PhzF family phenazine biosynthesis protein [Longimicrobiales bacterium]|nr:PhzF family phenazine biosynthesis protein [Longimicrobiales bacterium]
MTGSDERREWRMVSFPVPGSETGGNPAGVVLDPPEQTPEEMTRIAVRLNPVSETAFVYPPVDGVHPLRYFAPGGEVDLCGHATAAAYGVLALAGRLGELPARVRSTAPGGDVRGTVEGEDDGLVVWMDMPVARRVAVALDVEAIAAAVGLPYEVMASRPAAAVEDVGIRVALLPVADIAALDAMRPDFDRLRALGRDDRIIVFYPFVLDPETGRVRARSFAPAVDIDEDPATGTAAASLGAYLAREWLVDETAELRIRQGEAMGRPSELRLQLQHQDGEPHAIRVGGRVREDPAG